MKNRKKNSQLDEMQEQKALQIQARGVWIAFYGLFLSMVIQTIIYGRNTKMIIGEQIVFMCLGAYICVAYLKNGLWDNCIKPTLRNNVIASTLAAVLVMSANGIYSYHNYGSLYTAIYGGILSGLCTFLLCIAITEFMRFIFRKRRDKLDGDGEE